MSKLVLLWLQCVWLFGQPSFPELKLTEDVLRALKAEPKAQLEGILGEAAVFPTQNQGWLASVIVRLPSYPVDPEKGYLIAIAAYDEAGELLDTTRFELPQGSLKQPLLLYEILQVSQAIDRVAWYVRNNDTGQYTTQEKRDLPKQGRLSNLLLSPGSAGAMVSLDQNRDPAEQGRSRIDPLQVEGGVFPIFPIHMFNAPDTLYFYFTLAMPVETRDEAAVKLEIVASDERFGAPLFEVKALPRNELGMVAFFGNFDTLGFDAGEYQAVLTVTLPDQEPMIQIQPFQIIWQ